MSNLLPSSCFHIPATLAFFAVASAGDVEAALAGTGYEIEVLASNVNDYSFTQFEGLDYHNGALYTGNFRTVKRYDLATGAFTTFGDVPGNNGFSHVTYFDGGVYAAHFSSYSPPFPYSLGKVEAGSSFTETLTLGGVFDAAVSPGGTFYFTANPDFNNDDQGDGTRIFSLDLTTKSAVEVAFVGGASGGLTFDANGNLFYANFDGDNVLRFSASQLAVGGLNSGDASVALTVENPGYLDFDPQGNLLVSQLDGTTFEQGVYRYDLATGTLLDTVVTDVHGFTQVGETTYAIHQSWDFSGDYGSELLAITPVPESGHMALGLGICLVLWTGYRRSCR